MKVLAVSDQVIDHLYNSTIKKRYADIELLVSCGDLPNYYVEYVLTVLNVPSFYVRGNHDDHAANPDLDRPGGSDDLHRMVRFHKGMIFAGMEGCKRYNKGAVQYSEFEMAYYVLRMAPRMLFNKWRYGRCADVFVTHAPPEGIHDRPEDFAHRGFGAFIRFLDWYRPRYMLHGHIDPWDRRKPTRTQYKNTLVLNIDPYKTVEIAPFRPE